MSGEGEVGGEIQVAGGHKGQVGEDNLYDMPAEVAEWAALVPA